MPGKTRLRTKEVVELAYISHIFTFAFIFAIPGLSLMEFEPLMRDRKLAEMHGLVRLKVLPGWFVAESALASGKMR